MTDNQLPVTVITSTAVGNLLLSIVSWVNGRNGRRYHIKHGDREYEAPNPKGIEKLIQLDRDEFPNRTSHDLVAMANQEQKHMPAQLAGALALLTSLAEITDRARPRHEKLWLTLPEAADYTGLSETFLRRLVCHGKLASVRDRARKVRRTDLDSLDAVATLSNRPVGIASEN